MAEATNTTLGTIKLAGDLILTGDPGSPRLIPSGVRAGTYTAVQKIHVDTKGRTLWVGELTGDDIINNYVPFATDTVSGATRVGNNFTITGDTLSIPDATASVLGVAKLGTNLYIDGNGATSVIIPTATSTVRGIIQPGVGFKVTNGVLDIDTSELSWTTASGSVLGFVKKGARLTVAGDGTMAVDMAPATTSSLGFVKTGANITNVSGAISVPLGNPGVKGLVKPRSDMFWFDGDYKINIHWTNQQYGLYGLVAGAGTGINIAADGTMTCGGSFGTIADATTTSMGNIQISTGLSATNGVVQVQDGSASQKGILKVGTGLSVTSGVVSITLGNISSSAFGIMKVDGTTITASAGVITPQISATPVPTSSVVGFPKFDSTFSIAGDGTLTSSYGNASTGGVKGFVQAGTNMVVNNGVLDIQPCSATNLGVCKPGNGLAVAGDGTLSTTIPVATSYSFGGIKIDPYSFYMNNDTLEIIPANTSVGGFPRNGFMTIGSGLTDLGMGVVVLDRPNSWTGGAFGGQQKFSTLAMGVQTNAFTYDVKRKFTTATLNSGSTMGIGFRIQDSFYELGTTVPALTWQLNSGMPSADTDFLGTEQYLVLTQGALGTTQVTNLTFYGGGTATIKIKNYTPGTNFMPLVAGAVCIIKFEIVKTAASTLNYAVIGEILSYS